MKKLLMLLAVLLGLGATNVSAGVIGEVLYTDIGTLIDDSPIRSFNIRDYTYVIAEDLRSYGFDVIWDAENRTLSINHDVHKGYNMALTKDEINIRKSDIPMRKHYADVYSTDIATYLEGEKIDACNIDGRTLIQVDHLAKYGEFYYDDGKRLVEIRIMKPSFEYGIKIAENAVATQVDFYPGKFRKKVDYLGVVDQKGSPYGIGRVTDTEVGSVTYGYWDGYVARDNYYEEVSAGGRVSRLYGYRVGEADTVISLWGMGNDPYTMTAEGRYEYENGRGREGVYDPAYLYGFYITEEK